MRIKLNGTVLENDNEFVVNQWKKQGYKEFRGKVQKEPEGGSDQQNGEKKEEPEKGSGLS